MEIAVIKTGGKQYKVQEGDIIEIEKLTLAKDKSIDFDDILHGKKVRAKVLDEVKGPKVKILKYKSKVGYRKHMGHRQKYNKIKIEKIL